jgi:CMP-N,N'-diacetyllegionaminic acid synthase
MKVLVIVPARCGSKGFTNKNIAKVGGKTLLELAINVGLDCPLTDDIYISTDCKKYEKLGIKAGAKSLGLRPEKFATDKAKSVDGVIDLINKLDVQYDYLVLLQPTSPIREPLDIEKMMKLILDNNADASVSTFHLEEPHPYKLKSISNDGYIRSFIKETSSEISRQLLPKVYALNGSIYIVKISTLLQEKTFFPIKTIPYIMSTNINIDSEDDFDYLKYLNDNNSIDIYGVKK